VADVATKALWRHWKPRQGFGGFQSAWRSAMPRTLRKALANQQNQEKILEGDPADVLQPAPLGPGKHAHTPTQAKKARGEVIDADEQ